MRFFCFIGLLSLFLFSCSDEYTVPQGILPPPKMRAVMWDMIRAGEYQGNYVFLKDSSADKLSRSLALFDTVYRIHDITKDDFEKSYQYYREHPVLMKDIMDTLSKMDPYHEVIQTPPPGTTPPPAPDTVAPSVPFQPGNRAGLRIPDSLKKVITDQEK